MLNFSFGELLVTAIVGLIVLGPERMPKIAQKLGVWVASINQVTHGMKTEMNKQLKLDELNVNTLRAETIEKQIEKKSQDTHGSL
jgi:sec-independent protein translocase protein TatB